MTAKKRKLSAKHLLLFENLIDLVAAAGLVLWIVTKEALGLELPETAMEGIAASGATIRLLLRRILQIWVDIVNDDEEPEEPQESRVNSQFKFKPPQIPIVRETKDD